MKLLSIFWMLLITTMASAQTTELANCPGPTNATFFGDNIFCVQVPSATLYEWTFTDIATSVVNVHTTTINSTKLFNAGLFDLGASYNVTVRAEVSGVFGAPGASCVVNAPAGVATTQLSNPQCDSPTPLVSFSTIILAANVGGATEYEFEFTNTTTNAVTTYTNTSKIARLSLAGLFDLNTTYSVRVRAKVGATQGAYGTACTIVSPNTVASTSLRTCGLALNTFTGPIKAFTVAGATNYKFDFYFAGTTNLAGSVTETNPQTTLNSAGLLLPSQQYDVEVSVTVGSSPTFTTPGASCTVLSPAIVEYTGLANCGFQAINFSDVFNATAVAGATSYDFEFTDITNVANPVIVASSATTAMDMTTAGITANNTTYSVKVRATVNGVVGLYGLACNIFTPETIIPPSIVPSVCGTTLATYVSIIPTYQVPGATSYRYRFTNTTPSVPNPVTIFDTTYHIINLFAVGLITPGTTYDVEVSAFLNGSYTSYGPVCQVSSPALGSSVYSTGLVPNSCGATLPVVITKFATDKILGATQYEWEMTNTGTSVVTTHFTTNHVTTLGMLGLTEPGQTYSVRTRATLANGVVGPFSPTPCTLTGHASVPLTSLNYPCNTTLPHYGTKFPAHDVPGSNEYTFEFTNQSTLAVFTVVTTTRDMFLGLAQITSPNITFDVRVKARMGTTYGAYGPVCTVTTPTFSPMIVNDDDKGLDATLSLNEKMTSTTTTTTSEDTELTNLETIVSESKIDATVEFNVYPNPAVNVVNISTSISNYIVTLYSTDGKVVYQSAVENNNIVEVPLDNFTEGIYVVSVANSEGTIMETKKLSVIK